MGYLPTKTPPAPRGCRGSLWELRGPVQPAPCQGCPPGCVLDAMGWIVVGGGGLLFAVYATLMLHLAALGVAMDGARKKPPTLWSVLGLWLILLTVPLWGPVVWPINRLGYRVPVLGAPFPGPRRRRGGRRESNDAHQGDELP